MQLAPPKPTVPGVKDPKFTEAQVALQTLRGLTALLLLGFLANAPRGDYRDIVSKMLRWASLREEHVEALACMLLSTDIDSMYEDRDDRTTNGMRVFLESIVRQWRERMHR